jgi:phenylpyruvate tautomerase PptA (4-oxalocrotonate tautomerase family)
MPLVRIDVLEGRNGDEVRAVGEGVHRALIEAIGIPVLDRFQVITRHAPGHLIFDPENLDIPRTAGILFVQIVLTAGRTVQQKRALYAAIVRHLGADPGVRPQDVFVNLVEVAKENWSFGNGAAQYAAE